MYFDKMDIRSMHILITLKCLGHYQYDCLLEDVNVRNDQPKMWSGPHHEDTQFHKDGKRATIFFFFLIIYSTSLWIYSVLPVVSKR